LKFPNQQWPENYKPFENKVDLGIKWKANPNYYESYTNPKFMKTKIKNTKK